jgi:hypothetical protein
MLKWSRNADKSYSDSLRQFSIWQVSARCWNLDCPKASFSGGFVTLTEAKAAAEEMVEKAEVQRAAENRTKKEKGKKAGPKAAEPVDVPPPPPPVGFTITWPAQPTIEQWPTCKVHVWYSTCGLYRLVRVTPDFDTGPVWFGACYRSGNTWRTVEIDARQGTGYPRHHVSLEEASQAVENYHIRTAKTTVMTKSEEMMGEAAKAGLDRRPPRVTTPPAGRPTKAEKTPKEKTEGAGPGKRYDVMGFPVTAVLRWMGKAGWSSKDALVVMGKLNVGLSPATVNIQVKAGAKGERGEPAPLTPAQQKQLTGMKK